MLTKRANDISQIVQIVDLDKKKKLPKNFGTLQILRLNVTPTNVRIV